MSEQVGLLELTAIVRGLAARVIELEEVQRSFVVGRAHQLSSEGRRATQPVKAPRSREELLIELEASIKLRCENMSYDVWPRLSEVVGAYNRKAAHLDDGARGLVGELARRGVIAIQSNGRDAQRVIYKPMVEEREFLMLMSKHGDFWLSYNEDLEGGMDEPIARAKAKDAVAARMRENIVSELKTSGNHAPPMRSAGDVFDYLESKRNKQSG